LCRDRKNRTCKGNEIREKERGLKWRKRRFKAGREKSEHAGHMRLEQEKEF
jgi:hypothetical protein